MRQTKHRTAKRLEQWQRLSRRLRPRETHRSAWDVPEQPVADLGRRIGRSEGWGGTSARRAVPPRAETWRF
jgi:hypothetical protein